MREISGQIVADALRFEPKKKNSSLRWLVRLLAWFSCYNCFSILSRFKNGYRKHWCWVGSNYRPLHVGQRVGKVRKGWNTSEHLDYRGSQTVILQGCFCHCLWSSVQENRKEGGSKNNQVSAGDLTMLIWEHAVSLYSKKMIKLQRLKTEVEILKKVSGANSLRTLPLFDRLNTKMFCLSSKH